MRIIIDGEELIARNLDTARLRDIAELQRQTGWKMKEIREQVTAADIFGPAITLFLTLACYGHEPDWDDILDRDVKSIDFQKDPIDEATEARDAPDPQLPAPPDSSPGDEPPRAGPPPARTRSTTSRGSKPKSTAASSTSATSSRPSPPR